jgi:hypothetical protein
MKNFLQDLLSVDFITNFRLSIVAHAYNPSYLEIRTVMV